MCWLRASPGRRAIGVLGWLSIVFAVISQGAAPSAAADPAASRELMVPLYRFASGPDADAGDAWAISDDTRTVLFAYPLVRIPATAVTWIERDGRRVARVELPEELADADSVLVAPSVINSRGARALPGQVAHVRVEDAGSRRVELVLPADTPTKGRIIFSGRALPAAGGLAHETPPVAIPERARLEFGFGLLELRAADGPVRFEVSACSEGECAPIFSEVLTPETAGFIDRSISLDSRAGTRASFRFRASPSAPGTFFGLPVWSDPTLYAPRPSQPGQRNVLLISLDTLAANHLGAFGYARDTSPFIDTWFGRGGTIFERCFTAATTTGPSHMTLLTSLAPSAHGVHGRTYFRALPSVVPTLATVLARAGYATAAVTENGPMGAYRGFRRGFGTYAENKSSKLSGTQGHVESTFAAGRAWLERNRDKRFFLFLHTFQVHTPFTPPPAYRALFAGDGLDAKLEERVPPKWRAVRYDREIRYTDDVLQRFLVGATRDGLLEDTIVVLLSDHGEEFGEHGLLGHGAGVHDEVLRVPLMFRGPGIPAGRRVAASVSHIDFMPTLLELTGNPGSPGAGQSFAPLVVGARGAGEETYAGRPIFSEAWAEHAFRIGNGKFERVQVETPILVVRDGHRKLVRYPGPPPTDVYFDLRSDPGESNPLPATGDARDLRSLIDAYAHETRATRDLLREGNDSEPGAALDAERREKLRALGYLE